MSESSETHPHHTDHLVKERKEKVIAFIKTRTDWVYYVALAIIVGIATYIRTRPLPGLRDITTGGWTLGPDLDPFLFLRWAKYIVQHGSLYAIDQMRYVSRGFNTNEELLFHPYAIAWFHKVASFFGSVSVEQSAALYPVVFFALTVVAFFLMVRSIFINNLGATRANIIALISSFFLSVVPSLLPRTIAGIPEKESAAFFYMFLAFYGYLSAGKAKKALARYGFALLAGVSTALMALVWGGFIYIFMTLGLTMLISFLLGQVTKEKVIVYGIWLLSASLIMGEYSERFGISSMLTSVTTGIAFFAFGIALVDVLLSTAPARKIVERYAPAHIVPRQIISLFLVVILGGLGAVALYGPEIITVKLGDITEHLITPVTDRLGVTVAENRQPFYTEWSASFGPNVGGVPLFFWLFFVGSAVLYYFMLRASSRLYRSIMTTGYVIFLTCLIFSRYTGDSILNGTNSYSLIVYALGFIVLGFTLGMPGLHRSQVARAYYIVTGIVLGITALAWSSPNFFSMLTTNAWLYIPGLIMGGVFGLFVAIGIARNESLKTLDGGLILLFSLFFLSIVSARGAVRLIMVMVPAASILVAFFIVILAAYGKNTKDELMKLCVWTLFFIVIIAAFMAGMQFYRESVSTAQNYIPSPYTQQWQSAMAWVREATPANAVFAHWWDYGYWVQSIGERATVLDGGNAFPYWDYLMGRYALTGYSSDDALDFFYAHNVTHFLIDSSDIGKYGAFSSIGSDTTYDRRSYFTFFLAQQTQETKNTSTTVYQGGGFGLDQDLNYVDANGTRISIPEGRGGVAAVLIDKNHSSATINQPRAVFVYQKNSNAPQEQFTLPLRYAYYNSTFIDFGSGVPVGVYFMPSFNPQTNSVERDKVLMYLSNKTVLSQLARLYLYKEDTQYIARAHSEDDYIVKQLKAAHLLEPQEDIIYYQGFRGPISIWSIHYPQGMSVNPAFVQTNYPDIRLLRP